MQLPPYLRKILVCVLLLYLMFLTFGIRIQGVEYLPAGQFTENDAFLYQWMAEIIAENGTLPPRDTHRWLPLGRDNGQLLPLYSYAIAYTHKTLAWNLPYTHTVSHSTLHHRYLFYIRAWRAYAFCLSAPTGCYLRPSLALLLATLPGSVERSAAGFGDRDAWCWMFGVLAVAVYLWKEQIPLNPSVMRERGVPEKEGKGISNWLRYFATAPC